MEKILLSGFIKKHFAIEIANLEYHCNSLPYASDANCFGGLDFAHKTPDTLAIRGWLIPLNLKTNDKPKSLQITYNSINQKVLASKLSRLDVQKNFYFLQNSRNCGFVTTIENYYNDSSDLQISFELETEMGERRWGIFPLCVVSDFTSDLEYKSL